MKRNLAMSIARRDEHEIEKKENEKMCACRRGGEQRVRSKERLQSPSASQRKR
jgi:hypothetical protein